MRRLAERSAVAVAVAISLGAASLAHCSSGDANVCDADCIDVVPSPLTIVLTPAEVYTKIGEVLTLDVALGRGPGGDGDVTVTVTGAPGVSADPLIIAAAQTTGTLVLHIDASAFPQGDAKLDVSAQGTSASATAPLVLHVAGASGAIDTSFGSGGIVDLTQGAGNDTAHAVLALQDTILVGGTRVVSDADGGAVPSMMLVRLAATSGALDGTFGGGGFGFAPGELASIGALPDGRVFVVGDVRDTKASVAAYRFLANGTLDPGYAVVTSLSSGDDLARASAIQPGGLLVVAGSAGDAGAVALAKYTQSPSLPDAAFDAVSDSSPDSVSDAVSESASDAEAGPTSVLDPTFGDGGVVLTLLPKPAAQANALVVASDGSLYALGFQRDTTTDIIALHYTPSGVPDPSFADGGLFTSPLAVGTAGATAALLQPDGAIIVASDDHGQALLARLLPSGTLDATFGAGGLATPVFGAAPSGALALAREPATGKLIVGGFTGSPHQCLLARLLPSGAVDATFATLGFTSIQGGDACDVAAVAVQDDGRILVAQTVTTGAAQSLIVARYWP